MTKSNKRNILVLLILVMLLSTLSSGIVCASTVNSQTLTLEKYLTAIQNHDAETAARLYIDKRLSNDAEEIVKLNNLFNDLNSQIKSYKILFEKVIEPEESSIFAVKIEYTNGKIEQIPISVQKVDNEWSVVINSEFTDKSIYKLLNKGKEITTTDNVIKPAGLPAATRLTTWDYTFDINNTYKSYTSNFDVTANQVTLNYRQWGYNGTIGIEYAIVDYGFFVDTVYASATVIRDNQDTANQMVLACGKHSGLCLRVKLKDTIGGMGRTFGEVYNQ